MGPADQLATLLEELEAYQPDLVRRPRIVVGSKADVATFDPPDDAQLTMSGVTGSGVEPVVGRLAALVKEAREDIEVGTGDTVIGDDHAAVVEWSLWVEHRH